MRLVHLVVMKCTTTHPTDTTVKLTISVNKDELKNAEHVALTKLAKTVKAPGFREGKVPASVAAKHIDPETLAHETLENALSKAVAESFTKENIQALERPEVEVKKYVPGSELEFTAEAQILPEVKLGDYKNLISKIKPEKVTDDEINDVIERMKTGMSEKKPIEKPRAAKNGDETVIDFIGKKDGVAFDGGTGNDYPLTLGSSSFIPGFEEGVVGKKPGETFDIDVNFPDDYHVADLKGVPVTFTTTLKSINEVTIPEVDDDFAANAGPFKSVAEMKADIKAELQKQKDKETLDKKKDELVSQLVDKSTVPAPQVLIDDQTKSIERDMTQNLVYQNITLEQYIESRGLTDKEAWIETEVKPAAVKRVKSGLVLAELSKIEKITATDQEKQDHIDMYRQQYGQNPQALTQLEQPEVQSDIANRLLTEKTVERLVELNTKLTSKPSNKSSKSTKK